MGYGTSAVSDPAFTGLYLALVYVWIKQPGEKFMAAALVSLTVLDLTITKQLLLSFMH